MCNTSLPMHVMPYQQAHNTQLYAKLTASYTIAVTLYYYKEGDRFARSLIAHAQHQLLLTSCHSSNTIEHVHVHILPDHVTLSIS